jgi:hypothetical protein
MRDAKLLEENPLWVLELPDAGDLAPPVDALEQRRFKSEVQQGSIDGMAE